MLRHKKGSKPSPCAGCVSEGDKLQSASEAALRRVGTGPGECSEALERPPGQPCSSRRVIAAIADFVDTIGAPEAPRAPPPPTLPAGPSEEATVVRQAAHALGCGSESCVISHPRFRAHVRPDLAAHVLDAERDRRFKPEGPRDTTQLLSNVNIDAVLQEWAVVFPTFYNYRFNMMDFETTGGSLALTDVSEILEGRAPQDLGPKGQGLVRRVCDTFGCVLNTDISVGRGKHWVAVFGDCRGQGAWTVEYFNSAGNPPPPPVVRWLEGAAARLTSFRASHPATHGVGPVTPVSLTAVRHQDSQTECGNYVLYYIRRRLEGAPFSEFLETHIPDAAMIEFRKHLFRAN